VQLYRRGLAAGVCEGELDGEGKLEGEDGGGGGGDESAVM
jgi:hypothetical protein